MRDGGAPSRSKRSVVSWRVVGCDEISGRSQMGSMTLAVEAAGG